MTAVARKKGVSVASDWLSFVEKESELANLCYYNR